MTLMNARVIWYWERITSPHMAGLLLALVRQGCEVVYVAEKTISSDRARQGWSAPDLSGVRVVLVSSALDVEKQVAAAPLDSVHICDGIRNNGLVGRAQVALASRGLRQWVVMETVNDWGWCGALKRLEYRRLFWLWRSHLQGVLGTGFRTPGWLVARGVPRNRVFPFAYFLPEFSIAKIKESERSSRFRFVFVGRFIELKRLDLLIAELTRLRDMDFELAIIGSGTSEQEQRAIAEAALPGRIVWIGQLPQEAVPREISKADCLVLPSRHDGWGAVVSEALMVGTPVICSDRCGSAGVVLASGYGGVFRSGDIDELLVELRRAVLKGHLPTDERLMLAKWARCLGADAGAGYLRRLLDHADGKSERPSPPWVPANDGIKPETAL